MTAVYLLHQIIDVVGDVFRQVGFTTPSAVAQRLYGNTEWV